MVRPLLLRLRPSRRLRGTRGGRSSSKPMRTFAIRLRGLRGLSSRWRLLTCLGLVTTTILWLQLCFAVQVNSAILAQAASQEVQTETVDGVRPRALKQRDYWGRPFLYLQSAECFAVVSFGSDGKPDDAYDLATCKLETGRHPPRTSCIWPTMDTVYVNGAPAKACGK